MEIIYEENCKVYVLPRGALGELCVGGPIFSLPFQPIAVMEGLTEDIADNLAHAFLKASRVAPYGLEVVITNEDGIIIGVDIAGRL